MTARFTAGLAATVLTLPFLTWQLIRNGVRALPALVTAGLATEGSGPAVANNVVRLHLHPHRATAEPTSPAALPGQPAEPSALVVEDRPPDPLPDVTPLVVKAGGVRRTVQGPPCHDCRCCEVYGARLHDAHVEITRLRDEIVAADGRRINQYPKAAR